MELVNTINGYLWSYILIGLLLISGIFYTVRTGFAQIFLFGDMLKLVTGKLSALKDGEKKEENQVSAFQAFCISVSSHVGTGKDRKSTRLNSSHANISYAVFCLKKKKQFHDVS